MTRWTVTIHDEGWGERDYAEWQGNRWKHFYTTSVSSPHTEDPLTDGDRRAILEEFGLLRIWREPLSSVDTTPPGVLESMRITTQIPFMIQN
jgi:hypothetical protein